MNSNIPSQPSFFNGNNNALNKPNPPSGGLRAKRRNEKADYSVILKKTCENGVSSSTRESSGFLDRAFENACFVPEDDDEDEDDVMDEVSSVES